MKLHIATLALPFVFACSTSFATPAANPLPLSDIVKRVQTAGYSIIHEVEYKKDSYEAEVFNKQGKKIELKINAQTGEISNLPKVPNEKVLDLAQAVVALENAGYKNIRKIESENGYYKAKSLDSQGKKIKLKIDAITAAIDARQDD